MLPTPRFQNPFNQPNSKPNEITKPLFAPTFQSSDPSNYIDEINSSINPTSTHTPNINFTTYIQPNSNSYQTNSVRLKGKDNIIYQSSYNPKKQGFGISDDLKDVESRSVHQSTLPYFHNSSVGYTLPKYKPESVSSEIVNVPSY